MAIEQCDPDLVPKPRRRRPRAVAPPPPPAAAAAPAPAPAPQVQKITLASKALFDFDKYVLKPEGKAAIDTEIISKLSQVQKLELVLVTGHTDPIGTQQYNQKLSERRADAVRDYLVSKGVPKDKIETLGMGKTQPLPGVVCKQKNMKELIACLRAGSPRRSRSQGRSDRRAKIRKLLLEKPRLGGAFFSNLWKRARERLAMTAMQPVDLRIDARWIVPVEPAGALTGHALIVDGGRIVALVPAAEAPTRDTRRARRSTLRVARADSRASSTRTRTRR